MWTMDAWDIVLFVGAAIIAITTLARLMSSHRHGLVDQFQQQWKAEKERLEKERKKKSKDAA